MNNTNLKIAIQKNGRLTEETVSFLRASGLKFESSPRKLFSSCRNFPLDILYVRDDDIPGLVSGGQADLGILGQNVLNEMRPKVRKLLNLRFGFCSLAVCVPKESVAVDASDLRNTTIATSYPRSAKRFFRENNIPVKTITINGSVEIAPMLNLSSAIVDLVSTGSTLAINDLRVLCPIYRSEAVLIANARTAKNTDTRAYVASLLSRFKSVLSAADCKYIRFTAPERMVPKIRKAIPGLSTSSTSMAGIVKEDVLWELIPRLRSLGARSFAVLPVEKIIP